MKKLVPALLTIFLLCASAWALDVPDRPSTYVNDYASLLSPAARFSLEARLAAFDKETSNQLVVAVFPGLEGQSLEDFSIRLAEKWKPGTEKNDNGAILLIFRDDREVRIEVGYGLEGALPDAIAKRIIENEIVPRFKQGDFDGGVTAGVESILLATRGEYKAEALLRKEEAGEWYGILIFLAIVFYYTRALLCYILIAGLYVDIFGPWGLAVAAVTIAFLHGIRKSFMKAGGHTYTGRGGWYGGGWRSAGGGGFGGGFSGGGGSFGGGGASGRW